MFTGGTRLRLIKDSFADLVDQTLNDLGWYETGRWFIPVTFMNEPLDSADKVPLNSVAVSFEDFYPREIELGSLLDRIEWEFFVDIYAEDSSVGFHLAGDVLDSLKGKMASIGRTDPSFTVFDKTQDPSPPLFVCEIEQVELAKVRESEYQHRKNLYTVGGYVVDYYAGE